MSRGRRNRGLEEAGTRFQMVQGPHIGMECHYRPDEGWDLNAFEITTGFSAERARDETWKI